MAEGYCRNISRQDLYFDELLSGRLGGEKTFSGEGFKCPNVFMESSFFREKARLMFWKLKIKILCKIILQRIFCNGVWKILL